LNYILYMNDLQTNPEWSFKNRWVGSLLQSRIQQFPAVIVTGPRQVGKSTLLRHQQPFRSMQHFDLDDMELRRRVELDPTLPWHASNRIIIDEVHRVPDVLPALKAEIDRRQGEIRVVLSGSADLLMLRDVSESLAGRASYVHLHPFAVGEWEGDAAPDIVDLLLERRDPGRVNAVARDPSTQIHRGLLAPARTHSDPVAWWDAYVRTYLERDLRDLSSIQSLPDFRRVMELLAVRSGAVLHETEISRQAAVSQPTVHRWVNLLEVCNLVTRVPAHAVNRGKRVARRPRLYWTDPGLAAFLAGLYSPDEVADSRELGALFETLVLHHLRVLASLMTPPARLMHWRTSDGKEVDFVLQHGRRLLAFECKCTQRPRADHARHLRLFARLHPECVRAAVVHAGTAIEDMGEGILALPWTALAGVRR
jgi:hypothetical protein